MSSGHNFKALSCTLTYWASNFPILAYEYSLHILITINNYCNKFESNNTKFCKSLYAEMGEIGVFKSVGVQDSINKYIL